MKRFTARLVFSALALAGLALTAQPAAAGKFNKVLSVGDKAPAWEQLIGVDGKKHSLSDLKDAKVVVVAFTCNHCPIAQAYEDRFTEFAAQAKKRGVAFVAINVNTIEPDRLDKMKERAEQKGFNFPYLYDESQKIGKEYGAAVTPHLFVLDGDRKIAYMGAFDSDINRRAGDQLYVEDAVEAILAGKQPKVSETRPSGCSIKYEKE
jgi:peroxiredoxin